MVQDSQVALKHVIHDMEARTLVMELRRRAIKRWVPCCDMDCRLKIPHPAKVECGFRTISEECLYDSGPIGPSVLGLIIQYNIIQYNTIQNGFHKVTYPEEYVAFNDYFSCSRFILKPNDHMVRY